MIQRIKNKVAVLHMREVARGTMLAFALKVGGSGLAFAFNTAVARLLGAEGAGLYFLALAVTAIASVIGRVGLDNSLLRFVAANASTGNWVRVKGVYALGMRMTVVASGMLTAIVFFTAPWIASLLFKKPELAEPLRWMSLSILPFALLNLQAESFKGMKRIRDAMLVQGISVPLISLMCIYPLTQIAGATGVAWAYTIATVATALLGAWAWRRLVSSQHVVDGRFQFTELWASCKPLLVVAFMNRAVMPWMPIFFLGLWVSIEEVGVFGAASRVVMLVSFMLVSVNTVLAPKFAEFYARGELKAMANIARQSALLITLAASPIFLTLIFGGEWVMLIFGPSFVEGAILLSILAMGQLLNSITGSVNHILMVTGNEGLVRNSMLFWVLVLLLACLLLIPALGVIGAAIASALVTAGTNLTAAYLVWKKLGLVTVPFLGRSL